MNKPTDITFKKVLDSDGAVTHIELWQGDDHVNISMGPRGSHANSWRWVELRDKIDTMQEKIRTDALEFLSPDGREYIHEFKKYLHRVEK